MTDGRERFTNKPSEKTASAEPDARDPAAEKLKPALPPPEVAFGAIVKDITRVFHLNARHETFHKWKSIVENALNSYLGPAHPLADEFQAIAWTDPAGTAPAEGEPPNDTDELFYSNGLELTRDILVRAPAEAKKVAETPPPPPPIDQAPPPKEEEKKPTAAEFLDFLIVRDTTHGGAPKPVKIGETDAEEEAARAGAATSSVVSRFPSAVGKSKRQGLEGFMAGLDNPKHRQLVEDLKDILDSPDPSWRNVRRVLLEIYEEREELALRVLPLILKR